MEQDRPENDGPLSFFSEPGALTIEAAAADAGGQPALPRFTMVAYTGGEMRLAGWRYPVVVDLAGLAIPSQSRPIRFGHDMASGVGHTESIRIVDGKLVATGVVSRDTAAAKEIVASSKNGFPWQASIGAAVEQHEFVKEGQSVSLNGRDFAGPVNVVRKSTLGEISFVDLGADAETSVSVAASASDKEKENMDEKETQDKDKKEVTAVAPVDPVAEMRAKAAAETLRIEAVRKACDSKHPDIEAKGIAEGWDEAKTELEVLRAERPKAPAVHEQQRQTSPQVFEAVALMAAGISSTRIQAAYQAPILEAAETLRGVGIQEFCELACGRQLPRFRRDATGWLEAAFSTTSLPGILSNVANKMLLDGYNYIEDAWRSVCKIASVNDFKEHSRYRMTGSFKFEQVGPDGELKHGKLDEQKFGQRADTHGIMFALTRQMIINDDMGAFTDIPRQIGMGAAEAIADAVWTLWLSNPVQSDGKAFFSTDHKNYLDGADSILSVDGLTAAEVLFGGQVKPNGKPLGIPASVLLVPTALRVPADMLMKAPQLNELTTANKPKPSTNPHVGKYQVVSSVYLSNTSFTGASSKAWYLLSDPNRLPAIEVAFLNGVDQPTVEKTDADFNTLGIQFRGYIDFGVREQDYRGAIRVKGEA
jgi:phage major head subunit gpT-like protein